MAGKPADGLLKEKKIYQVINPRLLQAHPDITVECGIDLMQKNRSGYVVLAENERVVGIFTESDYVFRIIEKGEDVKRPIRDFMTKEPLVLNIKDSVGEAIQLMASHHIYHVPLVNDDQKLAGILSVRTLIRFLAECYPTEVYNLPPKPNQIIESAEGG